MHRKGHKELKDLTPQHPKLVSSQLEAEQLLGQEAALSSHVNSLRTMTVDVCSNGTIFLRPCFT